MNPPTPHQRRDGDIEQAIRFAVELSAPLQQRKNRRAKLNGFKSGPGVGVCNLAAGVVEAQASLPMPNLIQRFLAGSPQVPGRSSVHRDFKSRGHGISSDCDDFHKAKGPRRMLLRGPAKPGQKIRYQALLP